MPVVFIDAPPGPPQEKKNTLMKKVTDAGPQRVYERCRPIG
jgi:phenylpyruvate tautomerase PptA (4-oxalocrotonate tautomerase family)